MQQIKNPPNPFESSYREYLEEPPLTELQVYEENSQTILSKNDSPDLSFRWSLNPYKGCSHGCAYCFARPTHEYLGFGSGTDFQTKIVVKPRAPELLRSHFLKKSWKGELILFSGNTDCYQPLEAAWKLTRRCLEVCAEFRNPITIITKSFLVTRDIDLLKELDRRAFVQIFFSVPFWDEKVSRALEPYATPPKKRFEAMRRLSEAGLKTGISLAPLIPGLNDSEMPILLQKAKACGAVSAFTALLRLPGNVKSVFLEQLKERLPLKAEKIVHRIRELRGGSLYNSNFFERHRGEGDYWEILMKTFEVYQKKFALNHCPDPPSPSPFRIPSAQQEFMFLENCVP